MSTLRSLSILLAFTAFACSSSTSPEVASDPAATEPDGGVETPAPKADAGTPEAASEKTSPIGTLVERGTETVKGDPKKPVSCDALCKSTLDGKCDATGDYAGYDDYTCDTGRNAGVFYSCSTPPTVTNNQGRCTLDAFDCYCRNAKLTVPRVRVEAKDLPVTCREACTSHGLGCSDEKSTVTKAGGTVGITCDATPPAGTTGLTCACPK